MWITHRMRAVSLNADVGVCLDGWLVARAGSFGKVSTVDMAESNFARERVRPCNSRKGPESMGKRKVNSSPSGMTATTFTEALPPEMVDAVLRDVVEQDPRSALAACAANQQLNALCRVPSIAWRERFSALAPYLGDQRLVSVWDLARALLQRERYENEVLPGCIDAALWHLLKSQLAYLDLGREMAPLNQVPRNTYLQQAADNETLVLFEVDDLERALATRDTQGLVSLGIALPYDEEVSPADIYDDINGFVDKAIAQLAKRPVPPDSQVAQCQTGEAWTQWIRYLHPDWTFYVAEVSGQSPPYDQLEYRGIVLATDAFAGATDLG